MEPDEHARVHLTRNPPLAGRDRQIIGLRQAHERALSGHGSLVLVSGEAGIGKTALVRALMAEVREQDSLVLTGAAYDLSATPPYGPWLDLLDRYPQSPNLPPVPNVMKPGTGPADVPSQQALFTVLRDFLSSVAHVRPLLLVLEDLHWADQASLDLLRYLARQIAEHPILLVVTYRDDEVSRQHPLFQLLPLIVRESDTQRIELLPLNENAVRAIVHDRWALGHDDQTRLVEHLLSRAEGNPLFTIELARSLEQHGHLQETDGSWHLGDLTQVSVPTLVQQVIEARVARLGQDARLPLEIAAVIGQQVPLDVWQRVAHLSDDQLIDVLNRATSLHLLEPAPDSGQVQFVHALTREALYETILLPRRRALHRQVAETLAELTRPIPDTVAYHFQQAGDERAVEWLKRAAERAFEAHALMTAAERYRAALDLLPESDDIELERDRCWLNYRMGQLRQFSAPYQGIADLERARQIARQIGDPLLDALAELEIGLLYCYVGDIRQGIAEMRASARTLEQVPDSKSSASAIGAAKFYAAFWLAATGPYDEAVAAQEELVTEAVPNWERAAWALGASHAMLGRPADADRELKRSRSELLLKGRDITAGLASFTRLTLVVTTYLTDEPEERGRLAGLIVEDWTRAIDVSPVGVDPRIAMVDPLILDGDWGDARRILEDIPDTLAQFHQYAASRMGYLKHHQGHPDLAWQTVTSLLPSGPETTPGDCFLFYVMPLQRLAVSLALDAGDADTAREWLAAHDDWLRWSRATLGMVQQQLLCARLQKVEGELDASRSLARLALERARAPRQPLGLIASERFLGELDTHEKQFANAGRHLREALRLADQCAVPFERARTLLAMAELDAACGNRSGAIGHLIDVRGICTELGARPMLERAEQLMARLRPARGDSRFGLSARELEVLQLVVQGKSNREIAELLFISHRTVMQHVSNILRKLGVESRAGAVARALKNDLL